MNKWAISFAWRLAYWTIQLSIFSCLLCHWENKLQNNIATILGNLADPSRLCMLVHLFYYLFICNMYWALILPLCLNMCEYDQHIVTLFSLLHIYYNNWSFSWSLGFSQGSLFKQNCKKILKKTTPGFRRGREEQGSEGIQGISLVSWRLAILVRR